MYYTHDGKFFESKIHALKYANSKNLEVYYHYHDEVYDRLNWNIEPSDSLEFLYKQQAERIRDEYDYVILAYSGGYDSTNILETFFYNNIKLDKIIIVGAFSKDVNSRSDVNHNLELYFNAFPTIDKLGLSPITQKLDYTEKFGTVENLSISQFQKEWIHQTNAWFSPHHWFWMDIEKYIVPEKFRDKKVALIFGKDKPRLYEQSGKLGFKFNDGALTGYGMECNSIFSSNMKRLSFYWDPTYTDILVKQLHILKRAHPVKFVDNIVYNLKNPIFYKSKKSGSPLLSLRDTYMYNSRNSDIYTFHQSGINEIKNLLGYYRLPTLMTKFYNIE